jgi:hypothetical protein
MLLVGAHDAAVRDMRPSQQLLDRATLSSVEHGDVPGATIM